ncbi:hypothetical protein JCM6882_009637 [Rhodosporidiobolus microsporus]
MPRFILFDGAPTLAQCLHTEKLPANSRGRWRTFSVDLPPTRSTSPHLARTTSDEEVKHDEEDEDASKQRRTGLTTSQDEEVEPRASQFADADTTGLFSAARKPDIVPSSQPNEDEDDVDRPTKRARRNEWHAEEENEDEDEANTTKNTSVFLPAPSQNLSRHLLHRRFQLSQAASLLSQNNRSSRSHRLSHLAEVSNASTIFSDDGGTSFDATYAAEAASMGTPPNFAWKVHQLISIGQLRNRIGKQVSILAAVVDYRASDEGSRAPSTVTLIDHSGQTAKLVLWKHVGRQVTEAIQTGDILFIGDVSVKEYDGKAQLNFNDWTSRVGISWRTSVFSEEDEAYRFHEGWTESVPEAKRVLEEAVFFRQWEG